MATTPSLKVQINNGSGFVDYSNYVVDQSLQINDLLNQPTTVNFQLANFDSSFVLPSRSAYVRITSTKFGKTLATGFITQEPERTFVGPRGSPIGTDGSQQMYLYFNIYVTSDEWLLNSKSVPFIPAFVNQTMGQILRRLADTLLPVTPGFFGYDIQDGDTVPLFQYDPTQQWSQIAQNFANAIRFRYKAMDHVITFKPYGDAPLGISYNDSPTKDPTVYFDPYALKTTEMQTPVLNDVIVIGDTEPRSYAEDNFIGDGFSTDFTLRHPVFRGASTLLLQDDWTGSSFAKDLWQVVDPDASYALAGALNVVKTNPKTLGTSYILGNNGLELGGHLNLQHGEVSFTAASGAGLIGGVYSNTNLVLANCIAGYYVSGGNIAPVLNGVLQAPLSAIDITKTYLLQTVFNAGRWSRYDRVFRTLAGTQFGGSTISASADVTFLIDEQIVVSTANQQTVRRSQNLPVQNAPSFALYAPLNSINLQLAMTSTQISQPPQGKLMVKSLVGPTGTQLPILPQNIGVEQKYLLGFGLQNQSATLQQTSDVQQLRFYADNIPAAGSRIRLRTWEAGAAVGRVRSGASVAAEAKVSGDDGVRASIITNLNPLPRTSSECDRAAQAFITDRITTQYNGSYTVEIDFWNQKGGTADYPRTGRYLNVISPMRNISGAFLVRRVQTQLSGKMTLDRLRFTVEFGPDLFLDRLLANFIQDTSHLLSAKDATIRPTIQDFSQVGLTFIGDLPEAKATTVSGTLVSVDLGQIPATGAEVRRIDAGWGNNDQNRILLATTQTFTINRSAFDETFYIRQINGGKTSRYTTRIRVVYPQVPTAPTGSLDLRDQLKPGILLNLTGDIRNICGIEIRSAISAVAAASVSGSTVTGAPATGAINVENPMECLDVGLIGTDASANSTIPIVNQNNTTKKKFTRSEFLFDASGYDTNTTFFIEATVTNSSFTETRSIYIEKQNRGRNPAVPVFVQTLTVPPQVHRKRIRFQQPFTGYQYETLPATVVGPLSPTGSLDYTDAYRIWMQAEAPPTRVYPPSTIFPDSVFEVHKFRLIAVSKGARKTIIDIPMSGGEGEFNVDVGQSTYQTTSTTYEDITSAAIWQYFSSEWDKIVQVRLQATLSSPSASGIVKCALYDITAAAILSASEATFDGSIYGSDAATVQSSFAASGLISGHKYTTRIKIASPAVSGHFYKANLKVYMNPIRNMNMYWRFAAGPGNNPFKVSDAGITSENPATVDSRILYNPEQNVQTNRLLVEATIQGGGGGGTVQGSDNFNRADTSNPGDAAWTLNGGLAVPLWSLLSGSTDFGQGFISSNQLRVLNSVFSSSFGGYFHSQPLTIPWFVQATFRGQVGGGNARWGIFCNTDGSYTNGINWVQLTFIGGFNNAGLCEGGSGANGTDNVGLVAGDIIRIEARGDGNIRYFRNGIQKEQKVPTFGFKTTSFAGICQANLSPGQTGTSAWDDFQVGSLNSAIALIDAKTSDGPTTILPGWFGYTAGNHIPAQNWTVDPNFATTVNTVGAIATPHIDDELQGIAEIIMAAWQFELFAAVIGTAAAAQGKNDINNLRNTIIGGYKTAIQTFNTNQQDWVQASAVTFGLFDPKDSKRSASFATTALVSGDRYFAPPTLGVTVAWLVYQMVAVGDPDAASATTLAPPVSGAVLFQRRFFAPQDLNFVFDNTPYKTRTLAFDCFFFNLMWEYSPPLRLSAFMAAPATPKIDVISVLSIDVQIRLDVISTVDTQSVTVQMSSTSQFIGQVVSVKGGPLQSVYSLHIPGGPAAPIIAQYIRAKRTDYLGDSPYSAITYISADAIKNSTFITSQGSGAVVSNPLNNLFSYVSDGTTITWSWPAFTVTYSDGFVQTIAAGSYPVFSGLVNSTTYKFYPYLQDTRQATATVVILLSTVTSGTGDDPASLAAQNTDGRTALSRGAMTAATTSGGAGSGSGGGVG